MNSARRHFLKNSGGAALAGLGVLAGARLAHAADTTDTVEIAMMGTPGGARVWFHPIGVLIQPGQALRWTNHDPGNSHTVTSYHPSLYDRPRRIPDGAAPFDSGFLLPGESFSAQFTVPGVYDYYCLPHEHAGMVGRIIVARAQPRGWPAQAQDGLPAEALKAFPAIDRIMRLGTVD